MEQLESRIDTESPEFLERSRAMASLVDGLRQELARGRQGGAGRERHAEQKKMFVRERVDALLDPGSPFLELSPLAAHGMYDGEAPGAGLVTGIGRVAGREVMVVANDATVKGGTYFPMTVKKHLRAQEIALENRLPCVYLVDSGGAFLPLQAEVFPDREHFGRIFYNQARMSAAAHPAGRRRHGLVHGGRRVRPGDVGRGGDRQGHRARSSSGGPPLVKAATGEEVTAEELGGADVHTRALRRRRPPRRRRRARARDRARDRRARSTAARRCPPTARRPKSRSTTRRRSTASCRGTCASRTTCAR